MICQKTLYYTCIACKNHPQVYLEKHKYRTKKIQMSKFINTEVKSDSQSSNSESSDSESLDSDSESSDSDSDLGNLCISSSVNYSYILKCIFEGAI